MALESLPKIAPALFSAEQDLIEIYNKKSDTRGTINPSYIKSSPSGVSGAIQFSDGSAFSSDASNLFWDNTNKRFGVGTNSPAYPLDVRGTAYFGYNGSNDGVLAVGTNAGGIILTSANRSDVSLKSNAIMTTRGTGITFRTTTGEPNGAVVGIVGSGSTSATTSLLVQNSSGTEIFKIQDDNRITLRSDNAVFGPNGPTIDGSNCVIYRSSFNTESIAFNLSRLNFTDANGFVFSNTNYAATLTTSAIVDIQSTTKGFLPPRQLQAQRTAIASPAVGLMVYQTDGVEGLYVYKSTGWTFIA